MALPAAVVASCGCPRLVTAAAEAHRLVTWFTDAIGDFLSGPAYFAEAATVMDGLQAVGAPVVYPARPLASARAQPVVGARSADRGRVARLLVRELDKAR